MRDSRVKSDTEAFWRTRRVRARFLREMRELLHVGVRVDQRVCGTEVVRRRVVRRRARFTW